ncbi:MAG: DUF1287 domain-containing protein [Cytophagales bacterium]|nr:DUF1287 domain-containing protein [Armatimonadota bacterium]
MTVGTGCTTVSPDAATSRSAAALLPDQAGKTLPPRPPLLSPAVRKVVDNAVVQTRTTLIYDPAYVSIPYPGGDIPSERGVCADVIVRAYRAAGQDLQKIVHEDMRANFSAYPKQWGLRRPDPNIDHRRVANLMTYFKRRGQSLPTRKKPSDYLPGDVVAWRLPGGRLHIGLVSDQRDPETENPMVIHNIGAGTQKEDILFAWTMIGHYRSFGGGRSAPANDRRR